MNFLKKREVLVEESANPKKPDKNQTKQILKISSRNLELTPTLAGSDIANICE